jgi:hypothetical protein
MAWRTPRETELAALIGTRNDGARAGVGSVLRVIDDGRREVLT